MLVCPDSCGSRAHLHMLWLTLQSPQNRMEPHDRLWREREGERLADVVGCVQGEGNHLACSMIAPGQWLASIRVQVTSHPAGCIDIAWGTLSSSATMLSGGIAGCFRSSKRRVISEQYILPLNVLLGVVIAAAK